jgi:hypothetical protein
MLHLAILLVPDSGVLCTRQEHVHQIEETSVGQGLTRPLVHQIEETSSRHCRYQGRAGGYQRPTPRHLTIVVVAIAGIGLAL